MFIGSSLKTVDNFLNDLEISAHKFENWKFLENKLTDRSFACLISMFLLFVFLGGWYFWNLKKSIFEKITTYEPFIEIGVFIFFLIIWISYLWYFHEKLKIV